MKEITHIIHIADLHIRSGDIAKSRYSEYEIVMTRIIEDLSSYQPILNKQAIIIIAGDIFHHKLKIESPGLKLSLNFISGLSKLAQVYIIRGNHDYKQAFPDEPDLIESLLSIDISNVTYLNKTGHYKVHNIGFGLVSIQDALFSGNTQGITQDLPEFPIPTYFDDDDNIQYKIALFHGPVSKTRLPNGMEIMESHSYPLEWFKGYDSVMLGDIHLQQVNNSTRIENNNLNNFKNSIMIDNHLFINKLNWAYPGSTIQQDFGETLLGHGFLIWDLPKNNIQCYHTYNDYGFVTIRKNSENEWLVNIKKQFENKWIPLEKIIIESWFPKNIFLRIKIFTKNHDYLISNEIYKLFQLYNINVIEIRQDYNNKNNIQENNIEIVPENINLASFNTPNLWIEYLQDKIIQNNESDWKSWLFNKEFLILPNTSIDINKNIIAKINDKNIKFNKKLDEYQTDNDAQHNLFTIKKPFIFNYIQWDYILCFRDNNHFNFDNLEDNINSINAKNAQGKTSFLETICISLFGSGFPSRHNKNYSASIICQEKPPTADAKTIIHITINNIKYIITRVFTIKPCDINKIFCDSKNNTIDKIENNNIINIHTGKPAVDLWVETYIGTIQSFLLSCMISQNVDMDFFGLKSNDQKELLDNALCINVATKFHILLKEAKLHHTYIIDTIKTFITSFNNNKEFDNYPQKIIDTKEELENDIKNKELIITSYDNFNAEIRNLQFTNIALFKLGKPILYENISKNKLEYDSISYDISSYDITNITLEIGAYNNSLKNIGLENIISDYNKEDISNKIKITNAQINNIIKPIISINEINIQINSYNQLKNKICEEIINYNNHENNITYINDLVIKIKKNLENINESLTKNKINIEIRKQQLNELLKSQPIQPLKTIQEFNEYKKNICFFENKYSIYQNLIDILEELKKKTFNKPSNDFDKTKVIDVSSYDTLKYLLHDISIEIYDITDKIQKSINTLNNYQLEYNNTIKSQPLQSKNSNNEYLQWKYKFDVVEKKYNTFQNLKIQYDKINDDIQLPFLSKNKIDTELILLKTKLSKLENINYEDILHKQKKYDEILSQIKVIELNINDYNIKHIEILTNKPIVSIDNYLIIDEEYNKLKDILEKSNLPSDIMLLQSIFSKISNYNNIISNAQKRINEHHQILNTMESHPYNPECWACKKQPWKLHKDVINFQINDLNKDITRATKKITKYESLEIIQSHIDTINKFNNIKNKKIIAYDYLQWKINFDYIVEQLDLNKQLYQNLSSILITLQNEITNYEEVKDIQNKINNYDIDINTWQLKNQYDIINNDFNIWNTYDYWTDDNEKNIQFKLWQTKINTFEQDIKDIQLVIHEYNIQQNNLFITQKQIENDILAIDWIKYNEYNEKYTDIYNDTIKWKILIDTQEFWIQEQQKTTYIDLWKNNIIDIEEHILNEQRQYETQYIESQNVSILLQKLETLYKLKIEENELIEKIIILDNYIKVWNSIQILENELILYNKINESWNITDKINDLQHIINNINKINKLKLIIKDYQIAYDLWDEWNYIENNYIFIKDIEININKKQLEISLLQHEFNNYKDTISIIKTHNDYLNIIESRSEMLSSLYNEFAGFNNWIYNDKVIPSLVTSVNDIIKDICNNRPLFIKCNVNKLTNGSISLDWFLQDGPSTPPIEKASGFQKFIVGIAIRIALGSLGASGIKATQLFIDEGFQMLDGDNLAKVNDFLDILLLKYKQIVIVSHLQDLNDCAKKHIIIKRNINETTSQLQFGDKHFYDKPSKIKKIYDKPIKNIKLSIETKKKIIIKK
jgi:exonuclease SbcC